MLPTAFFSHVDKTKCFRSRNCRKVTLSVQAFQPWFFFQNASCSFHAESVSLGWNWFKMQPTFLVNAVDLLTAVFPGILKELILNKPVPAGPWTCGNRSWCLVLPIKYSISIAEIRMVGNHAVQCIIPCYYKDCTLRCIAWLWYFRGGHRVWPTGFCLQLCSAEQTWWWLQVHWAQYLRHSTVTSEFGRENDHILFPVTLSCSHQPAPKNPFYIALFPVQMRNEGDGWNTCKEPLTICHHLLMANHLCLSRIKSNSYSS